MSEKSLVEIEYSLGTLGNGEKSALLSTKETPIFIILLTDYG